MNPNLDQQAMWSRMLSQMEKIDNRLDNLEKKQKEEIRRKKEGPLSDSDHSEPDDSDQSENSSDDNMDEDSHNTPIVGMSYVLPNETNIFPDSICLPNSSIKIGNEPDAMAVYYQKGGKPSIIIRRDCPEMRLFLEELSTFSSTKKVIPSAIRGPLNKNTEQFIGWNLKDGK